MKSRVGAEAERRERLEERRVWERVRRQKMQMREKVGKSRNTMFFQWFVAPESRKVGSLKRRVRSQLARWEMKNCTRLCAKHISKSKCTKHTSFGPLLEVEMSKKCTPLWREAHFQVKMYKTHHSRTTFGSWDVEKVHAVVAWSTFWSQNVKNTGFRGHFWRSGVASLHYTTLHYTHYTCHCATLHTLHNTNTTTTQLHSTTLHYTKSHYLH